MRADFGDLRRAKFGHRPVASQAADIADETGNQLRAIWRMDDFGVELDAVILPRFVGDEGIRRAIAGRDDFKAGRKACDLVAMAHPHLMRLATFPKAIEQGAGFFHRN